VPACCGFTIPLIDRRTVIAWGLEEYDDTGMSLIP
jgi:hypothetical protein